jgi:hypothetical protein
MHRSTRTLLTLAVTTIGLNGAAAAEVGLGADAVSRYVWRGTDFGNAVTVQPAIAYSTDAFEVGAWSSWAIDSGAANENDLYVSFAAGPISVTVTDYTFPAAAPGDFFSFGDGDGIHTIEVMGSIDLGAASVAAAVNLLGDYSSGSDETSIWLEASLPLAALSSDDVEVSLSLGAGNGDYTSDTDPMLVSVGLDVAKGDYFGSYILNPDAEINFLVFGRSF